MQDRKPFAVPKPGVKRWRARKSGTSHDPGCLRWTFPTLRYGDGMTRYSLNLTSPQKATSRMEWPATNSAAPNRSPTPWLGRAPSIGSSEDPTGREDCETGYRQPEEFQPTISAEHILTPLRLIVLLTQPSEDFSPIPGDRIRAQHVGRRKSTGPDLSPELNAVKRQISEQFALLDPGVRAQGR